MLKAVFNLFFQTDDSPPDPCGEKCQDCKIELATIFCRTSTGDLVPHGETVGFCDPCFNTRALDFQSGQPARPIGTLAA